MHYATASHSLLILQNLAELNQRAVNLLDFGIPVSNQTCPTSKITHKSNIIHLQLNSLKLSVQIFFQNLNEFIEICKSPDSADYYFTEYTDFRLLAPRIKPARTEITIHKLIESRTIGLKLIFFKVTKLVQAENNLFSENFKSSYGILMKDFGFLEKDAIRNKSILLDKHGAIIATILKESFKSDDDTQICTLPDDGKVPKIMFCPTPVNLGLNFVQSLSKHSNSRGSKTTAKKFQNNFQNYPKKLSVIPKQFNHACFRQQFIHSKSCQ